MRAGGPCADSTGDTVILNRTGVVPNMGRLTQAFDNTEELAGHSAPEAGRQIGSQFDIGQAGAVPAALDQVAQGILGSGSPAGLMDAINAGQSALGNRSFMQFVEAAQQHGPAADAHSIAAQGMRGAGNPLTHLATIQEAFGHHDVRGMREHTGSAARASLDALDAGSYAMRGQMAFGGAPDLYSQAHEAAHGVQQAALGGRLKLEGGIGKEGDRYERHADAVAEAVVNGESAESLLDQMAGSPTKVTPVTGGGS